MDLHCDANELLARARRLIADGRLAEARPLLIDAAAVFLQSGDTRGEATALGLKQQIESTPDAGPSRD